MAGVLLLLAFTVVMALASFLSGALPLSMALSQSQLRLISSIGVGILVGTSLIVIIPEGIGAISQASLAHAAAHPNPHRFRRQEPIAGNPLAVRWSLGSELIPDKVSTSGNDDMAKTAAKDPTGSQRQPAELPEPVPTFFVGLALILGFVLMFLIDRLPRHASENFQPAAAPRHISLSNLGAPDDEESEGFLSSLTPTPKQTRSLATTTGLVIHAAADGIAMAAAATSSDQKLGFVIFIAIMVHKAPAAFGLTSILLKQGLSKRAARGHLIVFSLAAPVGAWATFILVSLLGGGGKGEATWSQWWTGMLLLFSAGTFLYVAMHAMQEGDAPAGHDNGSGMNGFADSSNANARKQSKPQMRDTLATVAGMLLPLLTQFGHNHG